MKKSSHNFNIGFSENYAKYRGLFAENNPKSLRLITIFTLSFLFGLSVGRTFLPVEGAQAAQPLDTSGPISIVGKTQKTEKSAISQAAISTLTTKTPIPSTGLYIPDIGLSTSVVGSVKTGNDLSVPAYGTSKYGSLIMGHVLGVFSNLVNTHPGQKLYLNGQEFTITSVERSLKVANNRKAVGNYTMSQLIYSGDDNLVLMTCAGSYDNNIGTYSHRTLVFATKA